MVNVLEFVFCKGDVHLQCLKTWSKEIQEHLKYRHKCVECMWLKKDDSSPEELQKDILEILHDRQRKLDESKNQIEANQQKIDAPSDIKNTGINLTPRSLPTRVFVSIIWNPEIERSTRKKISKNGGINCTVKNLGTTRGSFIV